MCRKLSRKPQNFSYKMVEHLQSASSPLNNNTDMDHAKTILRELQITKAQIRAVGQRIRCLQTESLDNMIQWRANASMRVCACAG